MASDRSSPNDRGSSRRRHLRDYALLALTALPAVALAVVGLGYLRYEVAIAERERNESARWLAGRLANRLNDGFEDYRQSEEIRLRTLPSSTQNLFSTATPEPRDSAANREAFEIYEKALDGGEDAGAMLEGSLASFDGKRTPAGLPLKPLAEYHLARLASEAGDQAGVVKWLGVMLESAVETQPSTISSSLVDRAADLADKHDCSGAVSMSGWQARWRQSNRTRELVRRHWDQLKSNTNVSRWFDDGGEKYYWGLGESNESVVYTKAELEILAGELGLDLIREGLGRRYPLAVRITFGDGAFEDIVPAPLNDPAQLEEWYQRLGVSPIVHSQSGLQLADAGGGPFAVRVASADPEAFHAAVRRRAMVQGGILIAVIACLGAGVWLTWRAMQAQRRLNARQADFISSVSHELRAPVAGIRLLSERLAGEAAGGDGSRRAEYVDLIAREASRLGTLVANVLDVTRIGQGRKTYHFEPADLDALVRDTVARMQPLAEERGVSMVMEIEALREDPSLDAVAIQQALGNLIDNAIKFSPEGGEIQVILRPQPEAGFVLSVGDQGPGIPGEEQARVFERFYRVGSELQRETPGAGIGLNLVRHIAEAHDGTVSVESTPGEGSRFVLRIPR